MDKRDEIFLYQFVIEIINTLSNVHIIQLNIIS